MSLTRQRVVMHRVASLRNQTGLVRFEEDHEPGTRPRGVSL